MKRILGGFTAAVIICLGLVAPAFASTEDFSFKSYHADFYLGADDKGRATLKTVETLVAEFPNYDQNHGIERAIPRDYDGHTTHLHIDSVTDGSGKSLHYETNDDGEGNDVLRIGDADTYVHGEQTYKVTYDQHDTTLYDPGIGKDQFYWDTNGTFWEQPFSQVSASVHLSDAIKPTTTGDLACYQGAQGSTDKCTITSSGGVITASADNLSAGENMTIAIGFTAGTFRGYQPSLWDTLVHFWVLSLLVTSVIGGIAIIWLAIRYRRLSNRSSELPPIPVEYIPPTGASVLTSAQIGDDTKASTTAMIIDLAVRHYITISQTAEKTLFKPAQYELEIVKSIDSLLEEEISFVSALFLFTEVGTKLQTKSLKNNYSISSTLQLNARALTKLVKGTYGLRAKNLIHSKNLKTTAIIFFIFSILTISPLLLVTAIVSFSMSLVLCPLTDDGLELRRYLAGLKVYIEFAEKDRIKALQSPEGAEKSGVKIKDGDDKKLIKLYERVLPYAVLFGQEKEWNKQLAIKYESIGSEPNWYVGQSAFNAAVFTSSLNDFGSTMNSYGASSSSSSGGSSGGGFSGGGGGGGGGGGW